MDEDLICAYLVIVGRLWVCSLNISEAAECPLAEHNRCPYPMGPFKPGLDD